MKKIAVAAVFVVVLISSSPFLADSVLLKKESFSFDTEVTVVNSTFDETKEIGLVTDSKMEFGKISSGMSVTKFFNITMPREGSVYLESSGNISEDLDYKERYYFEGDKEIPVKFNSTSPGYFTGNLRIKTQVPRNDLGKTWLDIKRQFF